MVALGSIAIPTLLARKVIVVSNTATLIVQKYSMFILCEHRTGSVIEYANYCNIGHKRICVWFKLHK
jgi:hypothetical protein